MREDPAYTRSPIGLSHQIIRMECVVPSLLRRSVLVTLLISLVVMRASAASSMNVVFVVVDDWGWADLGAQGSDFFETPHLDQFASESLRFTQAYSASPVCSPTRAALMTGKAPARLDMTIWHEGAVRGGPKGRKLLEAKAVANLPREEITLAEWFKKRDYVTAHIGKWHLGKAAYYPETQGFDVNLGGTYWGAPASFFFPYRGPWSASDPELRYVPVGEGQPGDYLTDKLTDHALRMLERHRDRAFFLNLWFHTVHTPIQGKPGFVARFAKKPPGKHHDHVEYAAMLASLDENVGRLLKKLEQLQLDDRTVVILTSDNGGVDFPSGKSGDASPTRNIPFRSGKGTLYEGGIRVPLMIRWPGVTRPGTISDAMVTSQDFYPTLVQGLLGFADEELPVHDGKNLMPTLRDPSVTPDREALYWHYPHYYPRMTPGSAIRVGDWKLIHYYEQDQAELYNVREDVGEQHDLASRHPMRARRLRRQLDAWRTQVDAKAPRSQPNSERERAIRGADGRTR